MEKLAVAAGATLFRQGDAGDAAYILEKGKIMIFQQVEGQRVELDTIRPGEIFGEMAVIDSTERMATAVAATDCSVTRVPQAIFNRKLEATDKFVRALVNMFIKNIRTSHRIFVRRPRSFRDNIKLIRFFAFNIQRYARLMDDRPLGDEMLAALEKVEKAVADLAEIGSRAKDKRHDHIMEEGDAHNVGLKSVMGTEGHRKL
ncbi:cAMP-binding protein [Paramagnetospirillum magnetotacticum MS-1]|uniref:cAMP-binding protein n=1 Tax=Paramagnetospirillum magnetotacticum MS-1 TaxID=272627 RepID=A0A0C2YGX4_PARME|nr:cyclic nucleotide-binding domain-containing protein [Paramagnetospirillum magnetotacticum]KIL98989.1 cAMP-binding protein [Paramagnetospirillum magnetotacticum MS-1]